jgi:hypothetical protein
MRKSRNLAGDRREKCRNRREECRNRKEECKRQESITVHARRGRQCKRQKRSARAETGERREECY